MTRLNTIIICLLITLVLGVVLVYPKCQELSLLQKNIKVKKLDLESKEEYLSHLNDLSEKLKKNEAQLSKIDSALPSEPSLAALFDFLQKASSQNGLVLQEISAITPPPPEGLRETRVTLVMTGSYLSLKSFLSTLEKSARMIEPESISFSYPEEIGPFSFNLRIKVYSY